MAWVTPKTNWSSVDGVRDTDMNRIEGNILQLYKDSSEREDRTIYVAPTGSDSNGTGDYEAPFASIGMALRSISKNTNGAVISIHVTTGTYNENIEIVGFDSPIILTGGYNATASIRSLTVNGCVVYLDGLHIATSGSKGVIATNGGKLVGPGRITTNNASDGITATQGSIIAITTLTCNSTTGYAIYADHCSRINVTNIDGSSNASGMLAQGGAAIAYTTSNLSVTGSRQVTYGGGRIYTGSV